jgi:hypothetical protein
MQTRADQTLKFDNLENVYCHTTSGAQTWHLYLPHTSSIRVEYNSITGNINTTWFQFILVLWAKYQCWWHDKLRQDENCLLVWNLKLLAYLLTDEKSYEILFFSLALQFSRYVTNC